VARGDSLGIGGAVTFVAILVALSSTAYRGEQPVDPHSGEPVAGGHAGTGSHNVLALGSLGVAVAVGSATVVIAKATRTRDTV
jgi:hypothetical protein